MEIKHSLFLFAFILSIIVEGKNVTGPKLNTKQALLVNQIVTSYALDLNGIENPLCKNHTKIYKESMRLFEPWALQMFDASSKLQPGLLVGNTGEFGSFEQCLQIYTNSEYGPIQGQMCTLDIIPGPSLSRTILRLRNLPNYEYVLATYQYTLLTSEIEFAFSEIKFAFSEIEITFSEFEVEETFDRILSTIKFNSLWSICLPDSCPVSDVERHFQKALKSLTEGLDVSVSLKEDGCVSYRNTKPITKLQWIVIIGIASFIGFILICTIYDIIMAKYNQESINQGLSIFSIYSNAKLIFSSHSDGSELDCLNGIRSLSICWVIFGHRYFHVIFVPIVNGLNILDWMQTVSSTLILAGTVSVDSFFMVSGLLVSYIFLNIMNNGGRFNLFLFYLHRYMRVTPVLGVMVLLYATVIELLGSGPIWNSSIHGLRDPCVNYWWSCLLHVQNYFNPSDVCVVQTWYLTCDMQFYFFSPIVLYPLWKWSHFGVLLFLILLVAAIGINFQIAWKYQFNGGMLVTNELLITKFFTHHYTTPYTRASPYLIGIAVGYILYHTKEKQLKINSVFVYFGWILSLTTFSAIVFGELPFQLLEHPYNRWESSLYLSLSRPAWTIALGWVVFNCVHGTGGLANTILSCYIFKVLAKLSYCMFLTHLLIMFIMGGAEKTSFYFSNLIMFYMFFGDFAFTLIASFILAVCVEIPIIRIDGALRKKVSNRKIDTK